MCQAEASRREAALSKVTLEFILCGVLLQRPQTGYELQRFMETTGRFMRTNTSMTQVYRSLRKLEDEGWLTHDVEPRLGAQDAKRYRLTPNGREGFLGWLRDPHRPTALPSDRGFFAQLRFRAEFLGPEAAIEMLDAEIDHRREQIARDRYRDRTEWHDADAPIDAELTASLVEWVHRRGTSFMDDHVAACVALRERLAAGELPVDDAPDLIRPADERDTTDQEVG